MNAKTLLLALLLVSVFLVSCTSNQSGYATYNQPPQQQQYVGGGCGVAPSADYGDTPIEDLDLTNPAL